MRNAFADELTKLGMSDDRVVLLSGDIGNRLFDNFKDSNEGRFINCGIAEANMMGMASGLALSGLRPVVYTITPFTTIRCLEQIKIDVGYHHAPVIIVGTGSGLSYASLGPTHHSCDDIAMLRIVPEMTVFCPCDTTELRQGLRAALKHDGPVYIRIGKKGEPQVHDGEPEVALGKALTVRSGTDVCLVGTGTVMSVLLDAADLLEKSGISTRVESFHTVKPLDEERLAEIFADYPLVAVAEEHSRIGGLYSAISEWLCGQSVPARGRAVSFSVADEFLHEVGSQDYARRKFGLTADNIHQKMSALYAQGT